jgi:hypothetical protein
MISLTRNQGNSDNAYVIKAFSGAAGESSFNGEVYAYRKVQGAGRPITSMTRFYGSYKHQDEYNIILEHADIGTLEDFMRRGPPRRVEEVNSLWRRLFELSQAVDRVHLSSGYVKNIKLERFTKQTGTGGTRTSIRETS